MTNKKFYKTLYKDRRKPLIEITFVFLKLWVTANLRRWGYWLYFEYILGLHQGRRFCIIV